MKPIKNSHHTINGVLILAAVLVALHSCASMGDRGAADRADDAPIMVPATVGDDSSLPVIQAAGYRFHGEQFGDPGNPPVIVLHGGPGADYRSLMGLRELADEFRVVFYDQRGSGLSPRVSADELSFDGSVEDLRAIADVVAPRRPIALVGHSFGGQLALAFATRYPARVSHLVLLEPGPINREMAREGPTTGFSWELFRTGAAAGRESQRVSGPDEDAREDFRMGYIAFRSNPGYACEEAAGSGTGVGSASEGEADLAHSPEEEYWRFGAVAFGRISDTLGQGTRRQRDLTIGIDAYGGETVFVAGSCNTVIGPDFQRMQAALIPAARLEVIEDAGHQLMLDQPEATVAVVRDALSR